MFSLARTRLGRFLTTTCCFWLASVPALAQKDDEVLPPFDVQGLEHQRVWLPWVAAFMFTILIILVGFKNPRRSHQD